MHIGHRSNEGVLFMPGRTSCSTTTATAATISSTSSASSTVPVVLAAVIVRFVVDQLLPEGYPPLPAHMLPRHSSPKEKGAGSVFQAVWQKTPIIKAFRVARVDA
uniref:Uncharacterized protein n=1 Tax=Anopheles merus TaxID=30066 RepID=A0A182V0X5_ANOME